MSSNLTSVGLLAIVYYLNKASVEILMHTVWFATNLSSFASKSYGNIINIGAIIKSLKPLVAEIR